MSVLEISTNSIEFKHLFFAKVTSEEVNLVIVKGLLDVKHVDTVASL